MNSRDQVLITEPLAVHAENHGLHLFDGIHGAMIVATYKFIHVPLQGASGSFGDIRHDTLF